MPEVERKTRGDAINTYPKFVKKKWGADGYNACKEASGIQGELKTGTYYPDEMMVNVYKWIHDKKGDQGLLEAGRFIPANLGVIGWLARFGTPEMIIKRVQKNFGEIYTFGRGEVDVSKPDVSVVQFYDIYAGPERCLVWKGIFEGFISITKRQGYVEKTKCAGKGDPCCEYIVYWNKSS